MSHADRMRGEGPATAPPSCRPAPGPARRLRLLPASLGPVALLLVLLLLGCGGGSSGSSTKGGDPAAAAKPGIKWLVPARPIRGLRQRTVGRGPGAVVVLWKAGAPSPRSAVVFLHSWEPLPPHVYGPWLRHLAEAGETIIYPAYQENATKPATYLAHTLAGIRAALGVVRIDPNEVVALGMTTGGVLAFDYAAEAAGAGLPVPRAALAVYPGRDPGGGPVTLSDLSKIPPATRLEVIGGPGDPIPGGERQGLSLLQEATAVPARRRRFRKAADRNRYGPGQADRAARRSFWAPTDRLFAEARGR